MPPFFYNGELLSNVIVICFALPCAKVSPAKCRLL